MAEKDPGGLMACNPEWLREAETNRKLELAEATLELVQYKAARLQAVVEAFLARYRNPLIRADSMFSDIAEMATKAINDLT